MLAGHKEGGVFACILSVHCFSSFPGNISVISVTFQAL